MPSVTYAGLFIGNLPDMDPIEGTTSTTNPPENSHAVLNGKTFGGAGSPLYAQSTRITLNDTDGDGQVSYNQYGKSETISYRLNNVLYDVKPDTTAVVQNCTIVQRLNDGTTRTVTGTLRIMQDVNGNAFVMPPKSGTDPGEGEIVKYPILSIKMPTTTGSYGGTGTGLSTTRQSLTGFRDGYVDGTDGNDVIDADYAGDPDGDRVDNNDAILPGATGNDDFIRAGAGNDTVYAGDGRDMVRGGDGDDVLYGYGRTSDDGASDTLDGGAGNDRLYGGGGDDSLLGGDGNDTLDGGTGNDTLEGGAGRDSLTGGDGNDRLYGDDTAGTGAGDADTIDGGAGDDLIVGGAGGDSILGGAGNDTIYGDDTLGASTLGGNDFIDAGAGNDSVNAGIGNDTVIGGLGADTVQGGAGNDLIFGDDTAGADTLGGNDLLSGGDGDDTIHGGHGNDTLQGDAGNDSLVGGAGDDNLQGGDGDDTLLGGTGDDVLNGGAGNDWLEGGEGADTLTGGDGADTFFGGNGDVITDFNAGDDPLNRDSLDLSGYYNEDNLAIWNALHPDQKYATPLGWLRADQADGRLDMLDGKNGLPKLDMQILNGGTAVDADKLIEGNTSVVCFGADAMIDTARGPVAAGDIAAGDMVRTRDAGFQPVRWAGARHLTAAELAAAPNLRPIRIRAGALGRGVPSADLVVSPQHRVLVRSRIAQKMFGAMEVLVAAKQLLVLDGIDVAEDLAGVTYVHFLFDEHQVVWSNGAETESLHTGEQALKSVGPTARAEIFAIFPELRDGAAERAPARILASGRMGRRLAMRHLQKDRPLVG